jgi:hypothetical protein
MKALILFCMFMLMLAACTPTLGTQAIEPTQILRPANPTYTLTPPTEGINQSATLSASETPTAATTLDVSTIIDSLVTGAVQIGGGGCCTGGTEGDTIQVPVSFSATSSQGRVSQMRVLAGCNNETDLAGVDWEPFVDSKTYPVYVALNWIGFYICVQYQDEHGNLSPVYRDDISVEGMPRMPLVNPVDWYPQIQCFSEAEVRPHLNEVVSGTTVTFSWPDKNQLPRGVFYRVDVFAADNSFAGLAASGQTRETSLSLPIDPKHAGQIAWYITLVDADGTQLEHRQCDPSFTTTLLKVNPPEGLKAVYFQYQP